MKKTMNNSFRLAFVANMSADDGDTGELLLYGEIIEDYSKWYKEQFPNDKSASDLDKAVKELKSKGAKKLKLRINSPGGIVSQAVAMRAIITGAGFESINIRIEGMCASAATLIASIPGANVEITPGSEYMIHNPWTLAWGNANEMEKVIDHLRQLEETSRQFYVQKSGQTAEQIKEWMDNETWFTAEDAVKYGFADELAKEEVTNALPAAACVTSDVMAVMKLLYKSIPSDLVEQTDEITSEAENAPEIDATLSETNPDATPTHLLNVRHGEPSGEPSEIKQQEVDTMDITNLTMEELREGNPALFEQVRQDAVEAERERLSDIDALTIPGYEEMAEQAKANGTSVMDFQKQIVAAMKKKGESFLASRQTETAPAQEVIGGEPAHDDEDQTVNAMAKEIAEYAASFTASAADGMF